MEQSKVTKYMAAYLRNNNIQVSLVARQTGIAPERLRENGTQILDAADFLTLCSYLGLRPEKIAESLKKNEQDE